MGHDAAKCLEEELRLVSKHENHHLKHALFDFKMITDNEIKMQLFLLGNGNLQDNSTAREKDNTLFKFYSWKKHYF